MSTPTSAVERLFAAVDAIVHASGIAVKELAGLIGVRHGYLLRAADANQDDLQLQVRHVVPLTLATGNDILIRTLAQECGGLFVRIGAEGRMDAATAHSLKEFGEFIASIAEAQDAKSEGGAALTLEEFLKVRQQALESAQAVLAHVEGLRISGGFSADLSVAQPHHGSKPS